MKIVGAHVVFHRLLKVSNRHSVLAVLLCKRTQDAPTYPGHWSLIGGKLNPHERPKDAAVREVQEELKAGPRTILIRDLCDVKIRRANNDRALFVRYFHSTLHLDMDKLTLKRNTRENKVEGEGLAWFTAEEVHHLMIRPEDRIAILDFFRHHGT